MIALKFGKTFQRYVLLKRKTHIKSIHYESYAIQHTNKCSLKNVGFVDKSPTFDDEFVPSKG